ncbi:MAG: chaperone NapD [Bacteroidota bacterium]
MNLSSIIVQVSPKYLDDVIKSITESDLWEYHLHDDKGRIIVTIEGENAEEEVSKLQELQALKHVVSAEMAFAYSADELEKAREKLDDNQKLPKWLNNPNANLSDIKYGGDLKGKY